MGLSSSIAMENKLLEFKNEINDKQMKIKDEITEPGNYSYCLNEREISYIEELKEIKDLDIVTEKEEDNIYPLFRKIELDITIKECIIKEYLVFYIPKNYSKYSLIYQGKPPFEYIKEFIEKTNPDKYPKYAKINNSSKAIKKFECKQKSIVQYASYISNFEFEISESDKETNLITLEAGYKIDLYNKYGLYELRFDFTGDEEPLKKSSFSFFFDDNYLACHLDKPDFDEISKNELYSFNREVMHLTLKNKGIKINIEDELSPELLSKFSPEEIKQINFSLNTIEYYYDQRHLIYHKVIHNIKDKKDYIKIYYVVFYPHIPSDDRINTEDSPCTSQEPIIINRFTINNLLINKKKEYVNEDGPDEEKGENEENGEAEENEENEEGIEMDEGGYYISEPDKIGFYLRDREIWALYEFECESNENLDYFQLQCNNFGNVVNVIYGSSYKYEIILNGHSIKFSNPDLEYSVENGKIILEGYIDGNKDNFDEKKLVELAKKYDKESYINEDYKNYCVDGKLYFWAELRLKEFLPEKMKLVENN